MALNECAECGSTIRSSLVWRSELLDEMVRHLSADDVAELVFALDEAVMNVVVDFGVAG